MFKIHCHGWLGRASIDAMSATTTMLSIYVRAQPLTRLESFEARVTRDGFWMPAYKLACWLVDNWWRIRFEPASPATTDAWKKAHNLTAVSDSHFLPDITFACDGERMEIRCRPVTGEMVRFLEDGTFHIEPWDFEAGVDQFMHDVLKRIRRTTAGQELQRRWDDVCEARKKLQSRPEPMIEALLGYNQKESPPGLVDAVLEFGRKFGLAATYEIAARVPALLPYYFDKIHDGPAGGPHLTIPNAESLRLRISDITGYAWQRGVDAARLAMKEWSVPSPLTNKVMADIFGIDVNHIISGDVGSLISIGFRNDDFSKVTALLCKPRAEQRRAALARIVGDHLNAIPSDRYLPVTAMGTARQKFQRAFALELLCPLEALKEFIGNRSITGEVIDEAGAYFGISPLLIAHKLAAEGVFDPLTGLACG